MACVYLSRHVSAPLLRRQSLNSVFGFQNFAVLINREAILHFCNLQSLNICLLKHSGRVFPDINFVQEAASTVV